ncbi:MAG: V-type ATP synthase subunit E [Desulfuromonadales bacterium]|nr:V-type ATP synthase subunit E [Desulfuromonadales bacterium]
MGQHELEAALRREGDEKIHDIWRQAEQQAEALRGNTSAELDRQQRAAKMRLEKEMSAVLDAARTAAIQKTQRNRLLAENRLVERLKQLAGSIIGQLAIQGGEKLFMALADEIPEHEWRRVMVNPRDFALAKSRFPAAEVVPTEEIGGGLKVESQEGRIVIVNSLEKRLEHLWPELLPEIFRDIRLRLDEHETVM